MFAGALVERQALEPPARAGAGVDAADVLQHIGVDAATRHLHRFAVCQLRHDLPLFSDGGIFRGWVTARDLVPHRAQDAIEDVPAG